MRSMKKLVATSTSLLGLLFAFPSVVLAQTGITNPVTGNLGSNPEEASTGQTFLGYLINIWQSIIFIGGLLLILYFIWGAIEWISAGGDSAKVTKARDRMVQSTVGMIVLVGSFAIIGLISALFFGGNFDLLNPVIPTPVQGP